MKARDIFSQIKDYIDAQNILDELEKFLDDDELLEFCNYLKDEYNIEIYNDNEFLTKNKNQKINVLKIEFWRIWFRKRTCGIYEHE